ncbi:uncharacterized protein CDV56_102937 [Aspergillus thermomutatus]|uniref:F-box domain-containing protein n=1 Tax=Aspergillus thermomutatus TaxID=41047 RepID=A0A397HDE8_ASPTH|nr:uncharacterized protein CDV56_102937 [Aspergillus thermomutatus]RHZ58380.1 hypothetical protein CDV56_102937 [Aspergillus thermomutatus]
MAYDCYCAICGVGFCGMLIETPSETATERRRRWIEKRSQALQAGQSIDQVPQDGEEPVRSYDPKILGWENVAWLYKAYCLGFNPRAASGKGKTFVSGPGYYADVGEIAIKSGTDAVPGQDRNVYTCYGSGTDDTPGPVIPFHGCCFEILTRVLTNSTDSSTIDMKVLYNVMTDLCNESCSALRLNYGDDIRRAQGRYWECIPGAEASSNATTKSHSHLLTSCSTARHIHKFKKPFAQFDLKGRSPASPFGKLPLELVYQICSYLPGDSLKALTQASLSIQIVTQDNWFWKRFIQWEMPWFWEFYSSQKPKDLPDDVNYKRLYMWLDKMTAARYGMDDLALIGVANRRRIWGVCEELATALQRAGFTVTIITRTESKSTFPPDIPVIRTTYTLENLTSALAGQDAAVCVVGPGGIGAQVTMIDAAEAAGVKRFIVDDFGWGVNPKSSPEFDAIQAHRRAGWDHAKAKADSNPDFTYTGISTGNPIDWALKRFPLMVFDVVRCSAIIYDSGTEQFTGTTLEGIGQSVVGVLQHPDRTANRFVKAQSIITCQNELLQAFQSVTGKQWEVQRASTHTLMEDGKRKFQESVSGWVLDLVVAQLFDEGQSRCLIAPSREESDADLLGIAEETAEQVVAKALAS